MLKAIGWSALIIGVVFIASWGLVSSLQEIDSGPEKFSVLNNGERTTGAVTSKELYDQDGDTFSFTLKYIFALSSGQEIVGAYGFWPADPDYLSDIDVGDQIQIAYDEQNPRINLPVKIGQYEVRNLEHVKGLENWFFVIVCSLVIGVVILILIVLASIKWRLIRHRY